jgi:hypothetical protein
MLDDGTAIAVPAPNAAPTTAKTRAIGNDERRIKVNRELTVDPFYPPGGPGHGAGITEQFQEVRATRS